MNILPFTPSLKKCPKFDVKTEHNFHTNEGLYFWKIYSESASIGKLSAFSSSYRMIHIQIPQSSSFHCFFFY